MYSLLLWLFLYRIIQKSIHDINLGLTNSGNCLLGLKWREVAACMYFQLECKQCKIELDCVLNCSLRASDGKKYFPSKTELFIFDPNYVAAQIKRKKCFLQLQNCLIKLKSTSNRNQSIKNGIKILNLKNIAFLSYITKK